MHHTLLFGLQFTTSFVVLGLLYAWYVAPRLKGLPLNQQLQPLVAVHLCRHLGLTVFAPGAMDPRMPAETLQWIAWGDFVALSLALVAMLALRSGAGFALVLVWVFNVESVADLVHAVMRGMEADLFQYPMGANWLVLTFVVPALWLSSLIIFYKLLRRPKASAAPA